MHTEAAYSGVGAIVELACAKRANIFYPPLPVKKCPPKCPKHDKMGLGVGKYAS